MPEHIIIGKSPIIKKIRKFIKKAASSDSNVLILGETGVGKELVARSIHCTSERNTEPFVKLNCACLNENLLESELFGHRKGAFTGALIDKPGLIESAAAGTVFLDEIGDMSFYVQGKLLSVVEDKEIRRIGENCIRKIKARFIFATNSDLYSRVRTRSFRADLYYRINILSIYIEPLRARKEDIPLLVESIQKQENQRKSIVFNITEEALNKISEHSYPGNVRELENILKRAYALSESSLITEESIVFDHSEYSQLRQSRRSRYSMAKIEEAIVDSKGNKSKAAAQLGMSRVHLYRLINSKREKDYLDPPIE